jgi:hypothetical protein
LVNGSEKFWNSRFGFGIIKTACTMKMALKCRIGYGKYEEQRSKEKYEATT